MKKINLQLKDKNMVISESDLDLITVDEWFLSLQIKYTDLQDDNLILEIDEDYEIFKDIVDSFKFRTLIITDVKKINYYEKLGEKWVFPTWLQDLIKQKKDELDRFEKIKNELLEIRECQNCKKNYLASENHSTSCQFHPGKLVNFVFTCCGHRPINDNIFWCSKSYHSSDKLKTLNFLKEYKKVFPD
jgi:hypothetical protein